MQCNDDCKKIFRKTKTCSTNIKLLFKLFTNIFCNKYEKLVLRQKKQMIYTRNTLYCKIYGNEFLIYPVF